MKGQNVIDVYSKGAYPADALSNFAAHSFVFDGVQCASMEGALQSFKVKNVKEQRRICRLVGRAAKEKGAKNDWRKRQTLYWKGVAYPRESAEYQKLLTRVFDALFTAPTFHEALRAAGDARFEHSRGRDDERETILTTREFLRQLDRLRERLDAEKASPFKRIMLRILKILRFR